MKKGEAAESKARQRAWKPKTKSGCRTCKIRRIKCDEEKPHCNRCTSTGRTCDGYDMGFRYTQVSSFTPADKRQTPPRHGSNSSNALRSQSPIALAPAMNFSTEEERQSFDFFTAHAITKLRGFLDSPFWQREVLQAAHREPAIQHCVVAMGAMYRRFHEGCQSHLPESAMSDKYLQFAFLQSNRAIKDLLKKQDPSSLPENRSVKRTDKITLMTCAILFSGMCCLQGYQKHAIEHLRSGIRMLNEMDEQGAQEEHAVDLESLRTIFVALDAQIRAIMPSTQSDKWVARPKTRLFSDALDEQKRHLNMSTLLAMLSHMECLLNHIHAFNQKTFLRKSHEQNEVSVELCELVKRFHRGATVMKHLWDAAVPGSHDEFIQPLTALELMQCQMEYLLRRPRADMLARFPCVGAFQHAKDPFKTPFDEAAQFARIFDLCNKLLVVPGKVSPPVFMTSMGPTAALWFIAIRAPSSCQALRRRAVALMLSQPRREGFWDGMVAGWIANEALTLEQERTRAEMGIVEQDGVEDLEVPDHLRIIAFWLTYPENEDRKMHLGLSDAKDLARGVCGAERWVSW